MKDSIFGALRLAAMTIIGCCVIYTAFIWAAAQLFTPGSADGHLVYNASGEIVGSSQVGQQFTSPGYFHSRPSAVDYNAAASGGSNLSPASPELRRRAEELIAVYGATADNPLPADLATASGSGLDPHISLAAAEFQIPRVAAGRNLPEAVIGKLVAESVSYPGGFLTGEPLVNVLELNLKLDGLN